MTLARASDLKAKRRSLKIGIIDLVNKKPASSLYARFVKPNFTSIMPQVVAVWVEEMGHEVHYISYTGFEDLPAELPHDIDLLFICSFTSAAYLAYSISSIYRKQNVVTVLGGPHARAFAEDARNYFDYVVGFTDKTLIRDLVQGFSSHPDEGVLLSAQQQPLELPGVRQRWKFIRANQVKSRLPSAVPMIGSLGCPYKCSFCIDSQVDYQPLPYDQIREDLAFLQKELKHPVVGWHDPNFGVRFDDYMEIIETSVKPGGITFGAESTLSLLSEPHLKRLQRNNFALMIVGVESWFDFNDKARQSQRFGMDKVRSVAAHVDLITRHIPFVQTNFVLGLDQDTGPLPFELTKKFLGMAPAAIPAYSLFTAFGNSAPLDLQLRGEGRVLDVPFPFLDAHSALNIRLKNYSNIEFYDHLIDLTRYSFLPDVVWKRFKSNKHSLFSAPRWVQLVRSKGVFKKGRFAYYSKIRHLLASDPKFQAFFSGESKVLPPFFQHKIKKDLGSFYPHLPSGIRDPLERGQSVQIG